MVDATSTSAKLWLVGVVLVSVANVGGDGNDLPVYTGCAPPGITCILSNYSWQWQETEDNREFVPVQNVFPPCSSLPPSPVRSDGGWCPTYNLTTTLTFNEAGIRSGSVRTGVDDTGTQIDHIAECVPCSTPSPTTSPTRPPTTSPTRPPTTASPTAAPITSRPTGTPTRVPTTYESANCTGAERVCREADPVHCPSCLDAQLKDASTPAQVLAALAASPCAQVQQQLLGSVLASCPNVTAMKAASAGSPLAWPTSQACVMAAHAYLNGSQSTGARYKCLDAVLAADLVDRVSTLLIGSACTAPQLRMADLMAELVPKCFPPCESAVFECFQTPRCRPYIVAPGTGPVTFNYSMDIMLQSATANVQLQCANVSTSTTAAVSALPATGNGTCAARLDSCAGNASCLECWNILQDVNSGETDRSPLTDNIFNCTPQGSPGLVALERACSAGENALISSATCLSNAWRCIDDADDNGASSQCIHDLVAVVDSDGLDVDDDQWYSRSDLGGSPEAWHAVLASSACQKMIQAAAGTSPVPNELQNDNTCGNTVDACGFLSGAWCQYWAEICDETPACQACLAGPPAADRVQVRYTPSCKIPISYMQKACSHKNDSSYSESSYSNYVQFVECTDSVAVNNRMVIATSVFGAMSFIAALSVVAVIIASPG